MYTQEHAYKLCTMLYCGTVFILYYCEFFLCNKLYLNINVHIYYNTVWGRPLQLLDSQFGPSDLPKMQSLNHAISNNTIMLDN